MKCTFIKSNGERCKAGAIKKSKYCWYHSPEVSIHEKKFVSSKGGKNRHTASSVNLPKIVLSNMQDIPAFLVTTIKRMDAGEIEIRLGTAIGYLSNVLMKSYEITDLEVRMEKIENYIKGNLEGEITDDYEVT